MRITRRYKVLSGVAGKALRYENRNGNMHGNGLSFGVETLLMVDKVCSAMEAISKQNYQQLLIASCLFVCKIV